MESHAWPPVMKGFEQELSQRCTSVARTASGAHEKVNLHSSAPLAPASGLPRQSCTRKRHVRVRREKNATSHVKRVMYPLVFMSVVKMDSSLGVHASPCPATMALSCPIVTEISDITIHALERPVIDALTHATTVSLPWVNWFAARMVDSVEAVVYLCFARLYRRLRTHRSRAHLTTPLSSVIVAKQSAYLDSRVQWNRAKVRWRYVKHLEHGAQVEPC
jgi:hypothetical protein